MASVIILSQFASLYNSRKLRGNLFKPLLLASTLVLLTPGNVLSHDVAGHPDPELLTGWRTGLHFTVQWIHLVAFALWLGLTVGTLLLRIRPRLDQLLYSSWVLFLVMLATGWYNMEYSAGIPETPSLLLLPLLERIPYGVTYTLVLAVKLGLYVLSILIALLVTLLHVGRKVTETKLSSCFLISETILAVIITLVTATVLFYHEVADLWQTAIDSLGGVVGPEGPEGPEGPRGQSLVNQNLPPPNDFRLLTSSAAWIDVGVRWVHLLGFGLWLGGSAATLAFGPALPARFLLVSWAALVFQVASGIASMVRWTPFYVTPYVWNLHELSHLRFGKSYTLFMATKHLLVVVAVSLTMIVTIRYLRLHKNVEAVRAEIRLLAVASLSLALAIAYIMVIVLLLHEGVDHVL